MLDHVPYSSVRACSEIGGNEDLQPESFKQFKDIHSIWLSKGPQTTLNADCFALKENQLLNESTSESVDPLIPRNFKKSSSRSHLNIFTDIFLPNTIPNEIDNSKTEINQEDAHIYWLNQKGYISLAQKFLLHGAEEPWISIKKIRSPILMEQLDQLHSLCSQQLLEEDHKNLIMNFAFKISQLAVSNTTRKAFSLESFNKTKSIMSELIYLLDKCPLETVSCLQEKSAKESWKAIEQLFNLKLIQIHTELTKTYNAHRNTQIQSPDIALSALLPKEIAKILLIKTGQINSGIIDELFQTFLPPSESFKNYQVNLSYALKLFQRSPKLRYQFEKVLQPRNTTMPSNEIIRASLNLNSETPITEINAKETLLAALLSHLRQDSDGPCFATSLAIEILSNHLEFCFKDLASLIHESKLTRTLDHVSKNIPFIKKIFDESLYKSVYVYSDGSIIIQNNKKGKIWEAPGIQAICSYLNIKNPQVACQAALIKFPLINKTSLREIKIKDFIEQLCRFKLGFRSGNDELISEMTEEASLVFSSQTTHPLLKIWENAIANIAEVQEGGILKKGSVQSVLYAFQLKLTQLHMTPAPNIKKSLFEIQDLLFEHLSFRYDPKIERKKGLLSTIKENGFVLYHHNERIDTPKKFLKFIHFILEEAYKNVLKSDTSKSSIEIKKIFEIFKTYLTSEDFLIATLSKFHPSNRLIVNLSNQINLLDFTPWICNIGHDSKSLFETYLESEITFESEKLLHDSSEERLAKIIKMGQNMSDKEKLSYINNPHKLTQFRIPGQHSSSLMLGHPSLAKAWLQSSPAEEWIEKFVLKPGIDIAEKPIDVFTKFHLLKRLNLRVAPQFLPKHKLINFNNLADEIPDGLSIKNYRNSILNIFKKIGIRSDIDFERIAQEVDTALYKSLKPNLKASLENSIIQFADTNWGFNANDLHFCFVINPGTGKLEIWQCFSNGTRLQALDQNYWLINKEWEFFHLPEKLLPDDMSTN